MSSSSVRINDELLFAVRREAKKNKQPIASYIESAVEEKLNGGLVGKIKADPELYDGWKANIAMAIKDAFVRHRQLNGKHTSFEAMHQIANIGAENFLNLLIK